MIFKQMTQVVNGSEFSHVRPNSYNNKRVVTIDLDKVASGTPYK